MTERFLVFGAGFSGRAIARRALAQGWEAGGTTRSLKKADTLRQSGLEPFLFDGTGPGSPLRDWLSGTTHLVVSIAPDDGGDPVLGALGGPLREAMPLLEWIGYLSTVGVYGDHGGAWVDEDAELKPRNDRSRRRVTAEEAWIAAGRAADVPVAIERLSGIYGPGRNQFVKLAEGTARRVIKPGQVFNRIHVADIAEATIMLAQRRIGGVFNVTDDEPAPPQDVIAYAAGLMNVEPPPETAFEDAEMTPMARSFYGDNKRISNARLKQAGHVFRFPDYRASLSAMWEDGSWRG